MHDSDMRMMLCYYTYFECALCCIVMNILKTDYLLGITWELVNIMQYLFSSS